MKPLIATTTRQRVAALLLFSACGLTLFLECLFVDTFKRAFEKLDKGDCLWLLFQWRVGSLR